MSEESAPPAERPSLQVAELTIENFRTFRERTVIPFASGAGAADAIATFHGDNGSGKSNAIAALQFLVKWTDTLLAGGTTEDVIRAARTAVHRAPEHPAGANGPMKLTVRFEDARLGTLAMRMTPAGNQWLVEFEGTAPAWHERGNGRYRSWFETPFGAASRPMAILHANRRASWYGDAPYGETIQPALAEELLEARLSRAVDQRNRWRDFEAALLAVPAFAGMDISIDRRVKGGDPELTFERRNDIVLGLEELSSGERQLVVLFAGVLLANAPIVVVEEPELSLDAKSQRIFYDFLAGLVQKRRIDQAIIESHVAAFDGPDVIRFERDPGGPTRVNRASSDSEAQATLTRRAREQNAQRQWVTRDGYTELPEVMRQDLGVAQGGGLWFLKRDRWEAWPDRDVEEMLGGGEGAESDRE